MNHLFADLFINILETYVTFLLKEEEKRNSHKSRSSNHELPLCARIIQSISITITLEQIWIVIAFLLLRSTVFLECEVAYKATTNGTTRKQIWAYRNWTHHARCAAIIIPRFYHGTVLGITGCREQLDIIIFITGNERLFSVLASQRNNTT